jgi:hypothetical protein
MPETMAAKTATMPSQRSPVAVADGISSSVALTAWLLLHSRRTSGAPIAASIPARTSAAVLGSGIRTPGGPSTSPARSPTNPSSAIASLPKNPSYFTVSSFGPRRSAGRPVRPAGGHYRLYRRDAMAVPVSPECGYVLDDQPAAHGIGQMRADAGEAVPKLAEAIAASPWSV